MTEVITTLPAWQKIRKTFNVDHTIGFVPTMGNLHAGHQSLLQQSLSQNSLTVLSLFVNPTQFNDQQDLAKYPRTPEADIALAQSVGVDYVFCPRDTELYPDHYQFQVSESLISKQLEGASRPGHFTGMLTVVLKLLLLVKPTRAYFGEKDFQQLELVKNMVDALFVETEIIACPTVREASGLAMSSRNQHLNENERKLANIFAHGMLSYKTKEALEAYLQSHQISVDYVDIWQNRLLAAVRIGKIRLIDNVSL